MTKMELLEEALRRDLGTASSDGALMVETGEYTGRAPKLRFIVRRPEVEDKVSWGAVNQPISIEFSHQYFQKLEERLNGMKTYSCKGYAACFPIEVKSISSWHAAFAMNMFRESSIESLADQVNDLKSIQVFHDPFGKVSDLGLEFENEAAVILDLIDRKIGIIGTAYAGEIKKAAFTLCNFWLPEFDVFPMHSSANCLKDGSESCVLFGLSGTGKTTLSANKARSLIGDDEIIWSKNGLSNIEGGCYAKLINLDSDKEPEIYQAANREGSLLENVVFDKETKEIDFCDSSKTENTRASYDITALENIFDQSCEAKAPKNIIFLTADAFGALPVVARLNSWQAQYHFISGYTSKVAGTEMGVREPQATFSSCFGGPFMPRHVSEYGHLLAKLAEEQGANIWLLNTGWKGGYEKGERYPIQVSRFLLTAIQDGSLAQELTETHPVFGFEVPVSVAGLEEEWLEIPTGEQVGCLAVKFLDNMEKMGFKTTDDVVFRGGPLLSVNMKQSLEVEAQI